MINDSVFLTYLYNLSISGYNIIILPDNLIESGYIFNKSFYFYKSTSNFYNNVTLDINEYADKLISNVPIKEFYPNHAIP